MKSKIMKVLSTIASICLWLLFLYVAFVAITVHLIPHFFAWELDHKLVIFLLLDAIYLQVLAWLYKKLPHKPKHIIFSWMEKISLFD